MEHLVGVHRWLWILVTMVAVAAWGITPPPILAQREGRHVFSGAAQLRLEDQMVDRMTRRGELRRRRLDDDTLLPGRQHERLDQYHDGVKVYGGDLARQFSRGQTVSIYGTVYENIDVDVTPVLSREDAAAVVVARSGVVLGPGAQPQLWIFPQDDGTFRLVYRARAFRGDHATEYFIDARSGAVVREREASQRQAPTIGVGTGVLGDQKKVSTSSEAGAYFTDDLLRPPLLTTYDMRGDVNRVASFVNGFITLDATDRGTDTDNQWEDPALVDAHAYAGYVYDYYFRRFGRRGLDDNNLRILSLVHPIGRSQCVTSNSNFGVCINAFYLGNGVMLYGDGTPTPFNGRSYNYLAGGLDVVAHELTHGVTDYTSHLEYEFESGALNESFSDMMGTAAEFFFQPKTADYQIGEDIAVPAFRSLATPGTFSQPDHYSRRLIVPKENDNGGVHTNSGISNQFFYLAIEGGTNRTSGLSVTGVGAANRERIEKVVYRAFTQMLPSSATFAIARAATIQAARDLYGAGSSTESAIVQAWTAVGVN